VRGAGFLQMGGGFWRGDFGACFAEAVYGCVCAGGKEDAFGLGRGRG